MIVSYNVSLETEYEDDNGETYTCPRIAHWMIICPIHEVFTTIEAMANQSDRLGEDSVQQWLDIQQRHASLYLQRMGCYHEVPTIEIPMKGKPAND